MDEKEFLKERFKAAVSSVVKVISEKAIIKDLTLLYLSKLLAQRIEISLFSEVGFTKSFL